MTAIDPNDVKAFAADEIQFWNTLQLTLAMVFEADPSLGIDYRNKLLKASPLQRALALHDDPLDAAATLVGLPVTTSRIAKYDALQSGATDSVVTVKPSVSETVKSESLAVPSVTILRRRRDTTSPLVPLATLNELMSELGYYPLLIRVGVAYYILRKRLGAKRPLPIEISMPHLPGRTADRDEVYSLDVMLTLFDSLKAFARRRKSSSRVMSQITKLRVRLMGSLR
ncbi:MAG: hypothetical protein QOC84_2130 [Bradyrhizobium sp.]|jgi:hypothetical protein|nr:hypothetical protein [Bradyrhizobium sp.]